MPVVSRPVGLFIAVSVVGMGIYLYASAQSDSGAALKATGAHTGAAEKPSDFTHEDFLAHFDPPATKAPLRNMFLPLIHSDSGPASTDVTAVQKDSMHVPAPLAGGESNWVFTGFAVINGQKSALFENQSTHHSDFVKEGAPWKATRLIRIQTGSVVFDDLAGGQISVTRFDPTVALKAAAKAGADAAAQPVNVGPALQGPIGPGPGGLGPRGRGMRVMNGMPPGGPVIVNGMAITVSGG